MKPATLDSLSALSNPCRVKNHTQIPRPTLSVMQVRTMIVVAPRRISQSLQTLRGRHCRDTPPSTWRNMTGSHGTDPDDSLPVGLLLNVATIITAVTGLILAFAD